MPTICTHRNANVRKTWFLFATFLITIVGIGFLFSEIKAIAQEIPAKSYYYDSIDVTYSINQDSTVDVEERQTYVFNGSFNNGWRSISTKGADSISDISIIDGETGAPLTFNSSKLYKLSPSSWGKYTTYPSVGSQNIEWYYNLKDTKHTWIIKYTLHGAIEFNKTGGRFYWNVFTDYDVPVKKSKVKIVLPASVNFGDIAQYSYRHNNNSKTVRLFNEKNNTFYFEAFNFAPGEDFTVDVGWPKGLVSRAAYWRDFIKIYYGALGGAVFILLALISGLIFWLREEKFKYGKRSIIPRYEPPKNLKPAMAELIVKEKLTAKGLSATAVDLAVRGYIKITEDKKSNAGKLAAVILLIFVFVIAVYAVIANIRRGLNIQSALIFVFAAIIFFTAVKSVKKKDYTLTLEKPVDGSNSDLKNYERKYLITLLIAFGGIFSTKLQRKKSNIEKLFFSEQIKKIKEEILKETEKITNAYIVTPTAERKKIGFFVILLFAAYFLGTILVGIFPKAHLSLQPVFLIFGFIVSAVGLFAFIKYEARLSKEGQLLKEEWLGFKMYLEVAEKYRLKNLTPNLFEKYLPYAMVFGVEKKWAKAFEQIHLENPSWYNSGGAVGGAGISSGSFSPVSFSSSFSSSFTSSFSSSGAAGSVGGAGGGGAGGGGGGGGGGAS